MKKKNLATMDGTVYIGDNKKRYIVFPKTSSKEGRDHIIAKANRIFKIKRNRLKVGNGYIDKSGENLYFETLKNGEAVTYVYY